MPQGTIKEEKCLCYWFLHKPLSFLVNDLHTMVHIMSVPTVVSVTLWVSLKYIPKLLYEY